MTSSGNPTTLKPPATEFHWMSGSGTPSTWLSQPPSSTVATYHSAMAPPKKGQSNRKSTSTKKDKSDKPETTLSEANKSTKDEKTDSENKKRKATSQSSDAPAKAQRRSVRSTPATVSNEEQVKLLNYLLSPECLTQTRPGDEVKDLESHGSDAEFRTYSTSEFTPLEELLSAMILSRPIGRKCLFYFDASLKRFMPM